jgi:hypothetical protein
MFLAKDPHRLGDDLVNGALHARFFAMVKDADSNRPLVAWTSRPPAKFPSPTANAPRLPQGRLCNLPFAVTAPLRHADGR